MPKILFYAERDLHLPFLLPVLEEINKNSPAETAVCAPVFRELPNGPGWGITAAKKKDLQRKYAVVDAPEDFAPDLTVLADACQFRLPDAIGPTVNLGHGMICKGGFYTPSPRSRRENLSSLLCVPGPWHREKLAGQVNIPMAVTGFIKTDLLFSKNIPGKKDFLLRTGLNPSAPIVLYAPTFNPELSSLPFVLPRLQQISSRGINILFKLHNMSGDKWFKDCMSIAQKNQNMAFLNDADYAAMMHHSDLILSDVSSIFVEFMLMDKPVLLFRHPDLHKFPCFDPHDIEYQVRDATTEIRTADELLPAIQEALVNPEDKSNLRQAYRQKLDRGRDGQSAARAARAILESMEDKSCGQASAERFILILDGSDFSEKQIRDSLLKIKEASLEESPRIYCVDDTRAKSGDPLLPWKTMREICAEILDETNTDTCVVLAKPGWNFPWSFVKHLSLHMFWNTSFRIVRCLAREDIARETLKHFEFEGADEMPGQALAHYLRTIAIGSAGSGICGPSPCALFRIKDVQSIFTKRIPDSPGELSNALHQMADIAGHEICTALDVFAYPSEDAKRIKMFS